MLRELLRGVLNGRRQSFSGNSRRRLRFERLEDRRALAGETFLVTNTNNSGAGSLRQAVIDANVDTSGDFISFAPLAANQTINLLSPLPAITAPVDFNGNLISGFNHAPLVEIHATYASHGTQPHGLLFQGSGFCQVIGISITGFPGDGIRTEGSTYLRVEDSYIGVTYDGQIGGNKGDGIELVATSTSITHMINSVISGNDGYGINLQPAAKNVEIVGCLVGTNPAGDTAYPNKAGGILISKATGVDIRDGNVISGNGQVGLGGNGITIMEVPQSGAATIAPSTTGPANIIGLNKAGNTTLPNQGDGIRIEYSPASIVKDNLISGNVRYGLVLWGADSRGTTTGTRIELNKIGTNAGGTSLGNGQGGIYLTDPVNDSLKVSDNFIVNNVIAHNGASAPGGGAGIRLETTAGINNRIQQNSIYANAGLGIDLDAIGVTPNDPGDGDAGANDKQNFPMITRAERISGITFLDVSLNSTPLASFTVELFVTDVRDSNGDVEGKTSLTSVTFDMPQTGSYTFPVSADIPEGRFVTATATKNVAGQATKGSTSEFSAPVPVVSKYSYTGTNTDVSIPVGATTLTADTSGDVTLIVDTSQSSPVVTKTGTGTFTLKDLSNRTVAVTYQNKEGTTEFNVNTGTAGNASATNWTVSVNASNVLFSTQVQNLAKLDIQAGGVATIKYTDPVIPQGATEIPYKVLHLRSLQIAGTPTQPTGKLDIKNNALIWDYGAGPNPEVQVRQWIIAGRGGPGMNPTWTGNGITSSTAKDNPGGRSVGYANNASMPLGPLTVFVGYSVDNTDILVRYTVWGDFNLDGSVNDDDSTVLGANYPGSYPYWSWGDADYDGVIGDDDATVLGANYDPKLDIDISETPQP
jgi:hypothetical protein